MESYFIQGKQKYKVHAWAYYEMQQKGVALKRAFGLKVKLFVNKRQIIF